MPKFESRVSQTASCLRNDFTPFLAIFDGNLTFESVLKIVPCLSKIKSSFRSFSDKNKNSARQSTTSYSQISNRKNPQTQPKPFVRRLGPLHNQKK